MTLEDLDRRIELVDKQFKISDDAGRFAAGNLNFDYPDVLPQDPFSKEYLEAQWKRYEFITGHPYSTDNEIRKQTFIPRIFPYSTNSSKLISEYLITVSELIGLMELKNGSRVLEFGIGTGATTQLFLKCGYYVTAIEINPQNITFVREENLKYENQLKLVKDDMMNFRTFDRFDAIVFFQSFHHAYDHRKLLSQARDFLKFDGSIYFCKEPISKDFTIPWGLANTGLSLWSLRKDGWFEQIFREDYFLELMKREGLKCEKYDLIYKAKML